MFTAPIGFAANDSSNQSLVLSDTHIFSPTFTGTVTIAEDDLHVPARRLPGFVSLHLSQYQSEPHYQLFPGIRANIAGFVK